MPWLFLDPADLEVLRVSVLVDKVLSPRFPRREALRAPARDALEYLFVPGDLGGEEGIVGLLHVQGQQPRRAEGARTGRALVRVVRSMVRLKRQSTRKHSAAMASHRNPIAILILFAIAMVHARACATVVFPVFPVVVILPHACALAQPACVPRELPHAISRFRHAMRCAVK